MSKKENRKEDNPNIGKNTRWDMPKIDPKAGQTIQKPPTSLTPKEQLDKEE